MSTDATMQTAGFGSPLYALLVKGRARPDALAVTTGLDPEQVAEVLEQAATRGLAVERHGRAAGWMLTGVGRDMVRATIARERDGLDLGEPGDRYEREFLPLNGDLKALCARWQQDQVDPGDDLAVLHGRASEFLQHVECFDARFSRYGPRLSDAVEQVLAGDHRALVKPLSDSYHDTWIELHEDLLLWLGRERNEDD